MAQGQQESRGKRAVARAFTVVEDVVYIGLGLLLAGSSIILLGTGILGFVQSLLSGEFGQNIIALLDRILLVLLFIELLYTVQVSFREHTLAPEPFLLVGLIAGIRRILVITAEFGEIMDKPEYVFRNFIIELAALSVLILIVVFCLYLLGRRGSKSVAERA